MDVFFGVLFLIICILLIVVVLLQKGRGGGLGAAFGGAGGGAFGTRTGDVFTWVTIVLTGLFLLLAIGTSFLYRPDIVQSAPPRFLPPPGPIAETTEVQIKCSTPRVSIFYTLDGTAPDDSKTAYEAGRKILVAPGKTIKAIAMRAGLEGSLVTVGHYPLRKPETAPATATAPASRPATAPTTQPASVPASKPASRPASKPGGPE